MAGKYIRIEDFPVKITLPVLWGHMDAFQHVNNVVYFRYFESVRIEYSAQTGLMKIMENHGLGPILAEATCKYIKALSFPDTIEVGCRTLWISNSEFEQEYGIHSHRYNSIVSIGTGLIVAYDYIRQCRSVFPEDFFEAVKIVEPNVEIRKG